MTSFDFYRLFRAILSPGARLDSAEIERMGLLAVKIAQLYAVRPDLVGIDKCRELARLLHRTQPLPAAVFEQRWNDLAPRALTEALAQLEPEPMAAASLGQVHRATLRDGRRVVVKIARTDGRETFLRDVARLRRLLKVAVFAYPKLQRLADPVGVLAAVEHQTVTEMDFLSERSGAERLRCLAAEAGDRLPHLRRLHFPEIFSEYSHSRLLVSECIEGRTLAEWLAAGDLPYEALLDLFRIHGYFLFVRGVFHGDLHPGNVIWRDGEFWFLDNGTIETIPPGLARGLFGMLLDLGRGDFHGAAGQLASMSMTPLAERAQRRFVAAFVELYRGFSSRTVAEISLTTQMMKTVKLAVASGLTFPPGAFPLIKSLMNLDGMVLRCAPGAVLLRDVACFAGDFSVTENILQKTSPPTVDRRPAPNSCDARFNCSSVRA